MARSDEPNLTDPTTVLRLTSEESTFLGRVLSRVASEFQDELSDMDEEYRFGAPLSDTHSFSQQGSRLSRDLQLAEALIIRLR